MTTYETCPKCDVAIGEIHENSCGVTRCKEHGFQRFSCPMPGKHTPTKFTGFWPGTQEAIERGWYAYLDTKKGWTACDEDHADATPDLKRVMSQLRWNSESEKFE